LLIGMTIRGGLSGIVSQAMSILSILLSWYVASRYFNLVSGYLPKENTWNQPVSIFVTFILCNIAIRIAAHFIEKTVKFSPLKEFDRQLGALLGLVKGFLLCLVVTFFAVTLTEKSRTAVASSQSGKYLVSTIMYIANIVPDDTRHAAFKKELAKFTAIVNDTGMETTSITDDIAKLKQDLKKQVILPDAEKQLAKEKTSGTTASKTVASDPKNKPASTSSGSDSSISSFMAGIDHFFSSITSPKTGSPPGGNPTTVASNSGNTITSGVGPSVDTSATHPLETLASNFSGFSGNISMGDATISLNVPGQGSGEPLVADVQFPDLGSELSIPLTSGKVNNNPVSGPASQRAPVQIYTNNNNSSQTQGFSSGKIREDQIIYSGSIMNQSTFSPTSIAPTLGQ
ncbi:MAG: CvpA family protein, partial [Planctomycetia bacterium]|nr:CvpA family protein [Planctomycetia bacterium]